MILRKLPAPANMTLRKGVPFFADHCLFVEDISGGMHFPSHFTGLGIIALLKGGGSFRVNDSPIALDENSFVVVNRGSTLSFKVAGGGARICLLYFNSTLSEILSAGFFRDSRHVSSTDSAVDFSLLEHVHYQNATLKNHLNLLIDLSNSCASFHSLKADMVIRSMLNDLMAENYAAISSSARLPVVKKTTQVALFKRLQLARQWMEHNFAEEANLKQAADIAMLNQEHFLRMFKQAFGTTPHQYLIEVRLLEAKRLLKTTDDPVSVICQQVGFESLSTFSGKFKQKTGATPAQFRSKYSG